MRKDINLLENIFDQDHEEQFLETIQSDIKSNLGHKYEIISRQIIEKEVRGRKFNQRNKYS
jgi:Trp operon repressor